jgi:hypothetical protein
MAFRPNKNYQRKDYNNSSYNSQQLHRGEKLVVSKFAEHRTTHERTYYGCIDRKDKPTVLVEYTSNLPHVAHIHFEEMARLHNGKLGVVSSY